MPIIPSCTRYFFIFSNCILSFLGLLSIVFGIWALLSDSELNQLLAITSNNKIVSAICIVIGILLIIFGLFGCLGSLIKKKFLLVSYLTFLVILVIFELTAVVFSFVKQENALDSLEYFYNQMSIAGLTYVHTELDCCGFHGPEDFSFTGNVVNPNTGEVNLSINELNSDKQRKDTCRAQIGCKDKLIDFLNETKFIVFGIGIGVLVFQFILIGLVIVIIKHINRNKRVKESIIRQRMSGPQYNSPTAPNLN